MGDMYPTNNPNNSVSWVNPLSSVLSELDGNNEMPRIERNLKQLEAVGKELWSRLAYNTSRDSCDIRASVLLGSKGYDLQKVSQHLESLSANKKFPQIIQQQRDTYDIQSFLKYERENAVLSVIEEVKKSTFELVDNNYWEYMNKDWDEYKSKLLNAFVGEDELNQSAIVDIHSLDERLKKLTESFRPQQTVGTASATELNDIECIINQILMDKNRTGYDEDIEFIYNLRDCHTRTIKLLNSHLGSIVAERKVEGSKRQRLELFALKLAERFCNEGNNADKEIISIFYLLLDLMTFFDYYHQKLYNDALDTITRLNILPFRNVDIKLKINQFGQYSEEIRRNVPEILIATMNILYEQYKEARTSVSTPSSKFGLINENSNEEKLCNEIRQKGNTLITYAGMINYRMPGDATAKLIKFEGLMN